MLILEAIPGHFLVEHGPRGGFTGMEMGPLAMLTLLFSWPSNSESPAVQPEAPWKVCISLLCKAAWPGAEPTRGNNIITYSTQLGKVPTWMVPAL